MNAEGVRLAVIGVGHLGSRHAERIAGASRLKLVALYDCVPDRAREAAVRLETRAAATLDEAIALADGVVVATSTSSHFEVAGAALRAGRHVLVEKPLTRRMEEAQALVALARETGKVLHVGHVERFNPAIRGLWKKVGPPLFIESHRLAPLVPRNLDIDVVQDLMVHDLDLALAFVREEPATVDAVGVSVLTGKVDIANARLRFPGGTVANLTASRVSTSRARKFRMFLPGTYVSADCAEGRGEVFHVRDGAARLPLEAAAGEALDMSRFLHQETLEDPGPDALSAEHEAFRQAILGQATMGVTGEEALRTLRALTRVDEAIREGLRERR